MMAPAILGIKLFEETFTYVTH